MNSPPPLYKTIDLARHAIVNASAGTGKTFTIQNLYVRLILERELTPAQILVLTFTEKATAELRQKIRKQLFDAQKDSSGADQERLNAALLAFDSAQIFTIHGFCQRALSQFAYENGEPFRLNTGDDSELYEAALRDLLRNVWPQKFGTALPGLLSYAGFPGNGAWEKRVINLAQRLRKRPAPADRIQPEPPTVDNVLHAQKSAKAIFARIAELSKTKREGESPSELQFNALRERNTLNGTYVKPGERLLHSALRHAAHTDADLLDAAQVFEHGKKSAKNFATVKKNLDSELAACPELNETAKLLRELEAAAANLANSFTSLAAWDLYDAVERQKRDDGTLSFDDMLTRLRDALDEKLFPETAPLLLRGLRARYSAAIVDEAQDTDRVQWDILQRIFAGVDNPLQRLYAVGDPKQAIYGFRGADVNAYLHACENLGANACEYTLKENWRSTGGLMHALNALFGEEYFPAKTRFAYAPVQPVADAVRKINVVSDPAHAGSPLVLYALNNTGESYISSDDVRDRVAQFTSAEIARLLDPDKSRLVLNVRGTERALLPGDICVLVRSRNEATPIEIALTEFGIPHSHYKKGGLYQSDEALELSCLFAAIARPSDSAALKRALLTTFFRMDLERLAGAADVPPEHRARLLLNGWRQKAERREWAPLFRSILDDTRVLLAPASEPDGNAERRQMNFQHLVEELENTARRQHLDFVGIADHLHRCRFESVTLEKDGGLQRVESERSKVQIMTLHVSKGLEFPVVFLAGGLKDYPPEDILTYHQNGAIIHDIQKEDAGKALAEQERDDETRRLYYVGLTRAQVKLYVPLLLDRAKNKDGKAKESKRPQVRLLGPRLQALLTNKTQGVAVVSWQVEQPAASDDGRTKPETQSAWELQDCEALAEVLDGQLPSNYSLRRRVHRSYSALKHAQRAFGEQRGTRANDERTQIRRRVEPLAFPGGTEAGSLLHALLETIDFKLVANMPSHTELAKHVSFLNLLQRADVQNITRDKPKYVDAAANIVWRALNTKHADGQFSLAQIAPGDGIRELEFTFPLPSGLRAAPEMRGYLNGFIDLIYRRTIDGAAKYFVLDWKSDVLDAYDAASMRAHMDAMDYTLQYKVYAQAIARWLEQSGINSKTAFGGIQYIFLRGVGSDINSPDAGILSIDVPADMNAWEMELYARLNERAGRETHA